MSVARPFSSIMGDMDVDQALTRLGISRSQLQDHTARMKHFLSSDATFMPTPGSRVFSQHASQPSLPTFPSTSIPSGSALARSRSLDSSGGFASSGPAGANPQETPSRTRKADSNEGLDERDSKRRRGEKTARKDSGRRAQNASGGDPARRLYTTEPIPPPPPSFPTLMHERPASVQQDVFYTSHMSPVASSSRTPSVAGDRKNNEGALLSVADVRATGVSPPSQSSHQSSSVSKPPSSTSKPPSASQAPIIAGPQTVDGDAFLSRYPLPPGYAWQPFEPKMPYHLPPGPFSQDKPALPYAALIGQALIASYFHRLPLHDITTYITIVHPYYKRSESTWQNSLRHNLSTNDSFERVDRHPDDHLTHGPCWRITPGHEKFFVGGVYCKPRNSPTKPKQEVKPDMLIQVKQELFPAQMPVAGPSHHMAVAGPSQHKVVAGPSQKNAVAGPSQSQHRYYRDRSATAPSGSASASRAVTPLAPAYAAFAAPNPTFNANYYRETTWKNTSAIPVFPPPGHALAYVPFRTAPPVIASSSPAPTPGGRVQRLRALLDDADSESDEEPSAAEPSPPYPASQHARSISASSNASLMDRKLLRGAPTSPITASLMERTLERKARERAQRQVVPEQDDDELELTPSPVLAALPLPEVDEPAQAYRPQAQDVDEPEAQELQEPAHLQALDDVAHPQEELTIDPEILAGRPKVHNLEAEKPDELDPALTLDAPFDALHSVAQAEAEEDAEEQDDSGYRSSNSSPGVPLALLLSKRKNDKQRQQELSAAFSFAMPPQSPLSDLRSTAARNIRKKGKRKAAKAKKKKAAPVEDEEPEDEEEGQEVVVPERYATPPPVLSQSSSQTQPLSPFRTPLTSRNTAGALARSKPDGGAENEASPVRRDIFSTPKRSGHGPFVASPFKTPILAEDPFNATTLLEQQLELLPQGSPLRDRPWGDALYNGYSLYGHDYY